MLLTRDKIFQFFEEKRDLFVSLDASKLFLRDQQAGSNPTLALVAGMPALHIEANSLDDGGEVDSITLVLARVKPSCRRRRWTVSISSSPSPRLRAALGLRCMSSRCNPFSASLAVA